jgi:hypothetical protein
MERSAVSPWATLEVKDPANPSTFPSPGAGAGRSVLEDQDRPDEDADYRRAGFEARMTSRPAR